jgi:hypothetical protein
MLQKQETTIALRPIQRLFLKGQRLTIDLPHTMKIHTTTMGEVDTTHTMMVHTVECTTGTTILGIADIK